MISVFRGPPSFVWSETSGRKSCWSRQVFYNRHSAIRRDFHVPSQCHACSLCWHHVCSTSFSERRVPQEGLNKYFVRAKRVSHPLQYNVLVLQQIADGIFSDTHPLSSFFKLKCCLSAVVAYFRFLSVRLNRLKNKLLANYLRNRGNDLATVRNSAFCVAILSNNSFICKYNIFFRKYELSVAIL